MKRESLKLTDENWQNLMHLAAATKSEYLGKVSWRRLISRIASGELVLRLSAAPGVASAPAPAPARAAKSHKSVKPAAGLGISFKGFYGN